MDELPSRPSQQPGDDLLAIVSHELRTPLTAIANALFLLDRAGSQDALGRKALDLMKRQVRHVTQLVETLLDFSRLTRGKVKLCKERLDLAQAVTLAVETVCPLLVELQRLTVSLPANPVCFEADATRLHEILVNLLTNAARYTPPGGHVWVRAAAEEGAVVFHVRDDGIGIHPNLLSRIFEPYTQGSCSREDRAGGLGIGLALVKHLVELHGGIVQAHSNGPGTGSEFVVRLPLSSNVASAPNDFRCSRQLALYQPGRSRLDLDGIPGSARFWQ